MVSGGVTVLSAYIIWLHHEEIEGEISFEGNLDVAAFLTVAAEVGLDIVLRIGPWCHGEVRNGGFPDWVQAAPVKHRTNHPGYLDLVRPWFAALGEQLAPLCGPGSSVVAVQVDNELYDQPDHLLTIKQLAQRSGIVAPLWTATAWGGAQLPADELLPHPRQRRLDGDAAGGIEEGVRDAEPVQDLHVLGARHAVFVDRTGFFRFWPPQHKQFANMLDGRSV